MKKLLLFVSIAAFAITSCSSDDNSETTNPGSVLLKKTIETDADGNVTTSIATYNGNKLDKITAGALVVDFTYTGDLITEMDYFYNGALAQRELYTYNASGDLIQWVLLETLSDSGTKEVYVHNPDGTISITNYFGDMTEQTNPGGTGTIVFQNGEVSSIECTYGVSDHYTYDNKNNPFKNVTGFSKISFSDSSATGIMHNILTDLSPFGNTNITYTYNSAEYPITAEKDEDGEITNTQFFYE